LRVRWHGLCFIKIQVSTYQEKPSFSPTDGRMLPKSVPFRLIIGLKNSASGFLSLNAETWVIKFKCGWRNRMNYQQWIDDLIRLLDQIKQSAFQFTPKLIGAVLVFLVGLLLARLMRAVIDRILKNLARLIPNRRLQSRLQRFFIENPASRVIGGLIYWLLIFFAVLAASEILGVHLVTAGLRGIAGYLPKILAAVLIVLGGFLGGVLVRDIITTTTVGVGIGYGNLLGRLAQIAILFVTLLIGVEQIGIDITFLTNVTVIMIGALLFGAALAFGFGARTTVSNILSAHYLRKTYQVGDMVRIGEGKGRIVQISPTAVILDSPEGQIYVPAKAFSEMTSILLTEEQ
jgi:small-conductance mechanosensitive channel